MDMTTRKFYEAIADNDLIKAKKCLQIILENNITFSQRSIVT